jgi:two-component system, NtrC family, response regulator AtoC
MVISADESLIVLGTVGDRSNFNQYFVQGISPAMRVLERTIADIARTDIPVLLIGESGTGKEVVALEIHRLSQRRHQAFTKCGCSSMTPESLAARFQCADVDDASNGGTLFLDEIGQLDSANQSRLLTLLPESGGVPPDNSLSLRLISSTTRNVEEEMRNGRFREELYYRINGVSLRLPPLRHRKEDIPILLDFFLKKYSLLFARNVPHLAPATIDALIQHSWPGNVRELENIARKTVALGDENMVIADLAQSSVSTAPAPSPVRSTSRRSLKEAAREASRHAERAMILNELERTHWNRKRTARELQISYKALLYKLKQLGLDESQSAGG